MPYFHRTGESTFLPTDAVGGAWDTGTQHIAPALGLLAHVIEVDRDTRRSDGLFPARLSWDIWGTVPVAEVGTSVRVLRAGRTIELVEAVLTHGGRTVATLRAWLLQRTDTAGVAGTAWAAVPGPESVPAWDGTTLWPGGFIGSVDVRRRLDAPGRGLVWVRTDEELVADEPVSTLARRAGLVDVANGMTVRADPRAVAFPNVDLTVHLLRDPVGEWLGLDSTVSFGPEGTGLTASVLHDETGPLGTLAQALTVRPA